MVDEVKMWLQFLLKKGINNTRINEATKNRKEKENERERIFGARAIPRLNATAMHNKIQ